MRTKHTPSRLASIVAREALVSNIVQETPTFTFAPQESIDKGDSNVEVESSLHQSDSPPEIKLSLPEANSSSHQSGPTDFIFKPHLDPELPLEFPHSTEVVANMDPHAAQRLNKDGTPALSKDGKRKSKGWGGPRFKGQKAATPQGRLSLPHEDSTQADIATSLINASTRTKSSIAARNVAASNRQVSGNRVTNNLQLPSSHSAGMFEGEALFRPPGTGNDTLDKIIAREASNRSNEDVTRNITKKRKSNRGTAITKPANPMMNAPPKKQGYTVKGLVPITRYGPSDDYDEKPHPDLARYIDRGTATEELHNYYDGMNPRVVNPLAGIVHEPLFRGLFREMVPDYDLEIQYHWTAIKRDPQFDEFFSEKTVLANREWQEENFHGRPAVRIPIPDHLKAMLVDDWENVTKNQMLVPIPSPKPVNAILNDYMAAERPKRLLPNAQGKNGASSQADILTEVVEGLREYFEKCLGRILLYKFERNQYLTVFNQINSGEGEFAGKEIGDIYGAEHFCRLLVTLPELIAQTNMNKDAVTHLREEIGKITNWLGKNALGYFASAYEHPGQDYIENARHS